MRTMLTSIALITLFGDELALASPLQQAQTTTALGSSPTVRIQHGTVVGSSLAGVDSFVGIPFAQPPVGPLRLKPPQPIDKSFGTVHATSIPTACPQFGGYVNTSSLGDVAQGYLNLLGLAENVTRQGEDCLTVSVERPSTATSSSKLPVLFWIYGGGFESGSTQGFSGANLVQKSVSMGQPIIFVQANYRLGAFGFLAGKELAKEVSTNLGLRDQRLALEWAQQNVAAFGGDPEKVTIWGESAGSISVFDQLVVNGGDNTFNGKPLFRGAMMDSGSVFAADPVTAPQAQAVYDTVADAAGCASSSDSLACLRNVDFETFQNAGNSLPNYFSYRSLDVSYLPRPDPGDNFFSQSPEIPLAAHDFAKVPIIIGDQEDEGSFFALSTPNISTNADLVSYLSSYFPGINDEKSIVEGLLELYPDEPLQGQPAGCPYGTGGANNIYPQFKRVASVLGDLFFILIRRNYLDIASPVVPSWSYLASYLNDLPVLGTFHSSDLLFAFGVATNLPEPAQAVQEYYINFVNHLDPNGAGETGLTNSTLINWPQYSSSSPQLLQFLLDNNTLTPDTFRQPAMEYIIKHRSDFKL